jgi:peptide/nickel transport system permease protein
MTLIATLIGASIVVFLVLEILPGNAAQILMGPDAHARGRAGAGQKLGLDRRPRALLGPGSGLLTGDLGLSYAYSTPVSELVLERLTVTVPLALDGHGADHGAGAGRRHLRAARHNKLGDVGLMGLTQVGIAIPNFWFAILLILLFSVHLQWFSAGGFPGWERDGVLARPAGAAAARACRWPWCRPPSWRASRARRCWRCMREDFVRTARAKGLSQRATLWGHVLRNALIPVITVMGLQFAELLAGTIVVENVFYLPGLGRLIFQSISNRDLIVVRNCVMLLAAMVVIVNFIVDVLYAVIDPRVKASDI